MMDVLMGWIVVILSLVAGCVALAVFLTYIKSHRLRIRDPNKRHSYINDYWVTEKKDRKTGAVWWVSAGLGRKIKIPEPPTECIDVGKKGRKFCEVYRLSEDEYAYIKDEGINGKDPILKSFRPLSTVQREVIVSQYIKAEELRSKNFLKENIVPAASMLSVVIVIIMLVVFWGDIAKPALESHSLALQTQEQNIKILHQLGIAQGSAQTLEAETQGGITTQDEKPPE